ncbi:MAG: HNH endonuclease [Acidobacteria bacterium]|nr:HNH endonuclease [Acidobacteriota bacterium]MCL5287241.1 HNH endonuclease [Acidobacteriota bacterium]
MVLDHVVPRVRGGGSSFRNVVACCPECNFKKRTRRAAGFLRDIYRSGRLTAAEFAQRLAALTRLARGQLRISLPR